MSVRLGFSRVPVIVLGLADCAFIRLIALSLSSPISTGCHSALPSQQSVPVLVFKEKVEVSYTQLSSLSVVMFSGNTTSYMRFSTRR
jgi:hypothetical protein